MMKNTFQLPLEEAQQVNDVPDSPSMGSFTANLNGNRLTVSGMFSDLTSALMPVGGADPVGNPESAIHIHTGEAGTNGPIVRNLMVNVEEGATAGAFEGEFDLSDEQVTALVNDGLYVNLHTMNFPAGELRGQIDIPPTVMAEGLPLEEAQQLNDVPDTASMGSFSATLTGNQLVVEGTFSNLTSALMPVGGVDPVGNPESAIHIHMGEVGENGPIIRNLMVDEAAGTFEGTFMLTEEEVATLTADGLYVNLHTMNFPAGELRGQIDVDDMTGEGLFLIRDSGDTEALFGSDADEFIAGRDGDNALFGGGGNDTLIGDLDDTSGNDSLFGGSSHDLIIGGMGSDTIGGESGNDTLLGDAGNDVLIGGDGTDILVGGGGSDVFVLTAGEGEAIITDFESGDLLGLGSGISASNLYMVQDSGNTVIGTFGGDLLAVVLDTAADQLSSDAFLSA